MPVTKYVYDGDAVLQETDGAGITQATYTRTGGGYGDLLSRYDGSAAAYFESDALGSTDALSDQSQAVTDRWAYRAYGAATHSTGADTTPFAWVGRLGYLTDHEISLCILGSGTRSYDPLVTQFLSPDPIGVGSGDPNVRRYAWNNPLNLVDPNGLTCLWPPHCGMDITAKIKGMKGALDRAFSAPNASDVGNYENCVRSHAFETGWDIEELHHLDTVPSKQRRFAAPGCSTGGCGDKVTVNGMCFFAGHVNYFFWGLLQRKCDDLVKSAKRTGWGQPHYPANKGGMPSGPPEYGEYVLTFPDGSAIRVGPHDHASLKRAESCGLYIYIDGGVTT